MQEMFADLKKLDIFYPTFLKIFDFGKQKHLWSESKMYNFQSFYVFQFLVTQN